MGLDTDRRSLCASGTYRRLRWNSSFEVEPLGCGEQVTPALLNREHRHIKGVKAEAPMTDGDPTSLLETARTPGVRLAPPLARALVLAPEGATR
jgi:hypothetical protein